MPAQVHAISIDVPLLSCQKALRTLVRIGIFRARDETNERRAFSFLGFMFLFLIIWDSSLFKSHQNPYKCLDL